MKWPCHGHGWQPAGSQSFQSWFLETWLYKRISLTEAIAALQQARSLQPKEASILFALGEANFSKKSTTIQNTSWF